MINLLHTCETMTSKWVYESDLRVPVEVFKDFARRNNFEIRERTKSGNKQFMLVRHLIPVYFISGDEESEFSFMDIADLHIGHPAFNEQSLREKLQYALDSGIKYVFIAGDLFEGCTCDPSESHYFENINLACKIFKDYPLTYFAISGNHDYSYEQIGLPNPIKQLEKYLNSSKISFTFFDTYLMDFVICGVIKRVMHVELKRATQKKYHDYDEKAFFALQKLKSFDAGGLLENNYEGITYPVRFFQVGHIHVNVQMYYPKRKIFLSQSGSFVGDDPENANIIKGKVIGKKILMN